jgi:hypothetical protein
MKMMTKSPFVPLKRGKDGTSPAIIAFSNHSLPFKGKIERDLEAEHISLLPNIT